MLLVCLQPDLCLIVGECGVKFQGVSCWGQHLQNKLALTEKLKSGIVDGLPYNDIQIVQLVRVLHHDQSPARDADDSEKCYSKTACHGH